VELFARGFDESYCCQELFQNGVLHATILRGIFALGKYHSEINIFFFYV
jgi:hypothetical protein